MGKTKEKLIEDMMFYPDQYTNEKGGKWDDFIPEIIEHTKKTGKCVSDTIKEAKEQLAMDNNL